MGSRTSRALARLLPFPVSRLLPRPRPLPVAPAGADTPPVSLPPIPPRRLIPLPPSDSPLPLVGPCNPLTGLAPSKPTPMSRATRETRFCRCCAPRCLCSFVLAAPLTVDTSTERPLPCRTSSAQAAYARPPGSQSATTGFSTSCNTFASTFLSCPSSVRSYTLIPPSSRPITSTHLSLSPPSGGPAAIPRKCRPAPWTNVPSPSCAGSSAGIENDTSVSPSGAAATGALRFEMRSVEGALGGEAGRGPRRRMVQGMRS